MALLQAPAEALDGAGGGVLLVLDRARPPEPAAGQPDQPRVVTLPERPRSVLIAAPQPVDAGGDRSRLGALIGHPSHPPRSPGLLGHHMLCRRRPHRNRLACNAPPDPSPGIRGGEARADRTGSGPRGNFLRTVARRGAVSGRTPRRGVALLRRPARRCLANPPADAAGILNPGIRPHREFRPRRDPPRRIQRAERIRPGLGASELKPHTPETRRVEETPMSGFVGCRGEDIRCPGRGGRPPSASWGCSRSSPTRSRGPRTVFTREARPLGRTTRKPRRIGRAGRP